MKRCPQCKRNYTDETLNYCLDDVPGIARREYSRDGKRIAIVRAEA